MPSVNEILISTLCSIVRRRVVRPLPTPGKYRGENVIQLPALLHATLLEPAAVAQVTLPDGTTKTLKLDPTANELVFGDTYKAGVYKPRLGTNDTVFCANLLDAAESNIKPRDELQLGKYTKVVATTTKRANMEVWRTIAALGLLVLLAEWWYYHRRTV